MAVEGLEYVGQSDFSAGAFPGLENVPANGCQEIINGLLLQDGGLQRRGGTTYRSTVDTQADVIGLWDGNLLPGPRTIVQDSSAVYLLSSDDRSPDKVLSVASQPGRWIALSHMAVRALAPPNQRTLVLVGGARPFTAVSGGVATATQGSATISGSSTHWASLPSGSILQIAGERPVVIAASPNDTTLTLAEPWPHGNASGTYTISAAVTYPSPDTAAVIASLGNPVCLAAMYDRLVVLNGNRISFTHFNETDDGRVLPTPLDFHSDDFHVLPDGVVGTGLEPLRETLVVFTTAGVWALHGLAFEITDDAGNPQQQLEVVSRELVLWGDQGLASWRGALVVPAADDVFLFDLGVAPVPVTGGARRLYRSYVKSGLQPGRAAVYRGHYLLPILDQGSPVDLLVWRLDMRGANASEPGAAPFAQWAGHGGRPRALVARSQAGARAPDLLGAVGRRVESYQSSFEPAGSFSNDADGSMHEMSMTTRPFAVAGSAPQMWRRLRARTEQPSTNPEFEAYVSVGRPGGPFEEIGEATIREDR
jgi:hypothetical protein